MPDPFELPWSIEESYASRDVIGEDDFLITAIEGVPKVAELIVKIPAINRARALKAAEQSYLKTARTLGYGDIDAEQWASVIMLRLRDEIGRLDLVSNFDGSLADTFNWNAPTGK